MHAELAKKIVDGIIQRQTPLYDLVYFYGDKEKNQALLAVLEEKYRKNHPDSGMIRTDADAFRRETREQLLTGVYGLQECDLYIFEHIDEIAGLEANEQRLYGILDWLLEHRRQIVICGTLPTADMKTLAHRIRAQMDGGICVSTE